MTGRVLVTGAGGFIGHHLLPMLLRHYQVTALSRQPRPAGDARVRWLTCDLLNDDERRRLIADVRPEILVHLAWYVEHGKFWTAPENILWERASAALLNEFRAAGGRRALCIGSCAEYDWNRKDGACWKESDPCQPATLYGKAKLALYESAIADAAASGLSLAWARLFLMFGEGERSSRLIPAMMDALAERRPFDLGNGARVRDLMAVQDLARGLAALLASDAVGTVNVASGSGISFQGLGEMLADIVGSPASLLRFGVRPDDREPPFMVADTGRLSQAGYTDRHPLRERLAEYAARRLKPMK